MSFTLYIVNVNTGDAWKENFTEWDKARKRCIKLRHSKKLDIVEIECTCSDDETELWHYYQYGY